MAYVRGWKKNPKTGKLEKVWIDAAKAKAIRSKVSGAAKKSGGPGVYSGIKGDGWKVDGNNVRAAVKSVIDSQVAPLSDLAARQASQADANINSSAGIKNALVNQIGQLQAQNSLLNTGVLGAASRAAASDQAGLGEAAGFLGRAFGPAYNAQVAGSLGDAAGLASTQGNTGAVQNAWGAGLTGQMQNDFATRAQQVAAATHGAFTAEQRNQQQEMRNSLARQIAAVRGSGAAVQRQFLREDATFGLERKAAEDAFKAAVAQAEADKMAAQYDWEKAKLASQTDVAVAGIRASGGSSGKASDSRYASFGIGSSKQDSSIDSVYDSLTEGLDKGTVQSPWRETFTGLTARGFGPDVSARIATSWIQKLNPSSITSSNARNWVKLLENRGVSAAVVKKQVDALFGPGSYSNAKASVWSNNGNGTQSRTESDGTTTTIARP